MRLCECQVCHQPNVEVYQQNVYLSSRLVVAVFQWPDLVRPRHQGNWHTMISYLEVDFDHLELELVALKFYSIFYHWVKTDRMGSVKVEKGQLRFTFKMDELSKRSPNYFCQSLIPLFELFQWWILWCSIISARLGSFKTTSLCVHHLNPMFIKAMNYESP